MTTQLASAELVVENEVRFSYFVKRAGGKPSRVGFAKVLDISETGLCMEISPLDSDLFMEPCGGRGAPNRQIELQIFCRSHPSNVFVKGSVQWFKQKKELDASAVSAAGLEICAGVVFTVEDPEQRKEISELLEHLKSDTVRCRECGTPVSANGTYCYNCAARLLRRRTVLEEAIHGLLAVDPETSAK